MSSDPSSIFAGGPSGRFAAVYRVLNEAIASHSFPGCAFGLFANGEILLQDALGRFTYEDSSPQVTPGTVFDLASLTKVVATTAMAMLLHQRGKLSFDTLLGDILPGFVVGREHGSPARQVTLRHLLAHNSGLPAYVEFFRTDHTPVSLFQSCLRLPLEAPPGARAAYSDPGFILLGKALELVAGESLRSFVRCEICAPLALHNTTFCPHASQRASISPTEQDTSFRHRLIQGEVQDENASVLRGTAGHAGLFSNVPDLLRFSQEILRAAHLDLVPRSASALFTPETIETFARRQPPPGSSRAIGWDTPSENSSAGSHFSPHSIGHLGFSGCSLWIDLDASVAAVLLTNRTWPDRTCQLIRQVRPAFHNALRGAL
jgi:CubicO group peptidase (beta-lactamase class C family)